MVNTVFTDALAVLDLQRPNQSPEFQYLAIILNFLLPIQRYALKQGRGFFKYQRTSIIKIVWFIRPMEMQLVPLHQTSRSLVQDVSMQISSQGGQ